MTTYKIVRFKFQGEREVLETGLTVGEAIEHCNNPESRSRTATFEGAELINDGKPWFDGFEEE